MDYGEASRTHAIFVPSHHVSKGYSKRQQLDSRVVQAAFPVSTARQLNIRLLSESVSLCVTEVHAALSLLSHSLGCFVSVS